MSQNEINSKNFSPDLVQNYPKSNRRLSLNVEKFGISPDDHNQDGQTVHISPYGVQFRSGKHFTEGEILKVHVNIPNYWSRKQKFVDYGRIDTPENFKILVKVVSSEDIGKRGKRKMVLARTVNMDEIDNEVLKSFLQDG